MSKDEMSIESLEGDQVIEMDINRLRDFKNHPFKVKTIYKFKKKRIL